MKKKLLIILSILALVLFAGCSSQRNSEYVEGLHFYPVGIVSHNDSLKEAEKVCDNVCRVKYSHIVERGGIPTPRLTECTEKECYCEC